MMPNSEKSTLGTVLLVDDTPENLQLLNDLLIQRNYTVRCVTNGKSAIKTSKIKPPDIVFLDIKMPEMDGYKTCEAFKQDPDLYDIPIIFISALDATLDKIKAFQVGGVDYITKPFQVEEVIARLENQLTIQRQKIALQNEINQHQQTQEILYQSRSLLANILNTSLDGIATLQAVRNPKTGDIEDFRCLVINPILSRVIGRKQEDLIGKLIVKKFLHSIDPELFNRFVHVVESGHSLQEDIYYPCDKTAWYHCIAVKLGDGLSLMIRNVTDRKLSEQALQKYERIVSSTKDGISLIDHNYIYQAVNETYLGWHKKSLKEVVGCSISDLLGSELFQTMIKPLFDRALSGESIQYETWFNYPDQSRRFMRVKYFPYVEFDGQISGVVANLHDLTDLKKIELDLAEAKEKAEAATKAKSQFLANVSHEIRTPMNGVLGMAQLLQNTPLTEKQQTYVQTIYNSSNELLSIINDILNFSKIESKTFTVETNQFAPRLLIQSVDDLLNHQAIAKGIHLGYTIDESVPDLLIGDEGCLRQILINLVANGIKFTEQGSVMIGVSSQIFAEQNKCQLIFTVQDTGIGIDGDRLNCLFQPFTQADSSINRVYGGTGLGLSICKGLVTAMGGEIWAESRGLIYHATGKAQTYEDHTYKLNEKIDSTTINGGSSFYVSLTFPLVTVIAQPTPRPIIKLDPQMAEKFPLKILLVEDNPMNQEVMDCLLETLGYSIDIVGDGIEAINAVTTHHYDVVFMDIQMPKIDGLTATQKIREQLDLPPQIIAMTANFLPEDRQRYLDIGMKDHLCKPIELQEVVKVLIQCFEDLSTD